MYKLWDRHSMLLLVTTAGIASITCPANAVADEIVDRVIARSQELQSGSFRFACIMEFWDAPPGVRPPLFRVLKEEGNALESGVTSYQYVEPVWGIVDGKPVVPDLPLEFSSRIPKSRAEHAFELVVAGQEWAIRQPGIDNVEIRRNDASGIYTENVGVDNLPQRGLALTPPGGAYEEGADQLEWRRVLRCGTIPTRAISSYVDRHRGEAKNLGKAEIDGFETEVISWDISQKDFADVVESPVPVSLYEGKTCQLKIYVDKSIGYCVRRTEFASPSGKVHKFFHAKDFKESGGGVYFPRSAEHRHVSIPTSWSFRFDVAEAKGINGPVDSSAFEITVPVGTRVRCTIPGKEAHFVLGKGALLADLDSFLSAGGGKVSVISGTRSSWRTILIFGNVALLLAIALVVGRSRFTTQR